MDLNSLKILVQVIDCASFTQAALNLGLTKSTVSRKLSELEEHLGVKLISRSTRRLDITTEGKKVYESSLRVLEIIQNTECDLISDQNRISGNLRVAMPIEVGHLFMESCIIHFMHQYPNISIDIEMTNRKIDLIGDRIDLYIQIGSLSDSSMISRSISFSNPIIVASPDYLKKNGYIHSPQDLCSPHQQIKVSNATIIPTRQLSRLNKTVKFSLPYRLKVNTITAAKIACFDGLGIAFLPAFYCQKELKEGTLINLLPEWELPKIAINLVYAQRKLMPKRLQALIEHIITQFAEADYT